MQRPTKAIIAAAGFGTRFLPQTKAMPKEMMPIIDKPIIQYVVEELVEAGIKDIIIVGSSNKRAIEDHFDLPNEDLLTNLRAGGEKKEPLITMVNELAGLANFIYIRQKGPYGNATPMHCAAHLIGADESFIYAFADDFIKATPTRFSQMIDAHMELGTPILTCKAVLSDDEYDRYGIVAGETINDGVIRMSTIVERPGKENAPSALASVSSYLFTGKIFDYIERANAAHDGNDELKLQPIVQQMIDDGYTHHAIEIKNGHYYDTGDKLEYIKTVLDFGLEHPELGPSLRTYINSKTMHQSE
ncbi:NTP transferase domain-containing protein [Candidatus Saccharibacteria bacterium]|nr:MAG: NTP transferase domain-containing protein [Candidatus Saccharibacteria bacterium]